jgi:pimeloyl-ACP methyl ester carboxylesterase
MNDSAFGRVEMEGRGHAHRRQVARGDLARRLLVRERGMDASRILITDLDADYRVHPQYFAYLAWTHLTDPNRETQLYQPIPYFHNNIWEAPLAVRLIAAASTQLQLWRSAVPDKLFSFSSYSTTLQMVHEVGYWATDAIPEDSRFYWKSYFRYGDRFRAAISERAVNAIDSFSGSSDIGSLFPEPLYGPPETWAKQSPLTYADRIDIPVLIIHSEEDWRCPVEQAQRLFVALKSRGAETEMLLFPAEGHELSRSGLPSHRVARFEAILDWWSRHL